MTRSGGPLAAFVLLAVAALAAFAPDAAAQVTGLPQAIPNSQDYSVRTLLGQMFGEASYNFNGQLGEGGSLRNVFLYFNLAVVAGGSVLFAWASLVGTMATAHDGQLLGKRWSSMWVPLRFVVSAAVLLPGGNGLSVIQTFVLWVVGFGVSIANILWTGYLSGSADLFRAKVVSAQVTETFLRPTTRSVLDAMVCNELVARTAAEMPPEAPERNASLGYTSELVNTTASGLGLTDPHMVLHFGSTNGVGYSKDVCGTITIAPPSRNTINQFASTVGLGNSFVQALDNAAVQISVLHANAIQAMVNDLRVVVPEIVNQSSSSNPAFTRSLAQAISTAERTYATTINNGLVTLIGANGLSGLSGALVNDMQSNTGASGWVFAGSWFYSIASVNDKISKVAEASPRITAERSVEMDPVLRERLATLRAFVDAKIEPAVSTSNVEKPGLSDVANGTFSNKAIKWLFNGMDWGKAADPAADPDVHPLVKLKKTGDYMMGSAESVYLTMKVLQSGIGMALTNGVADKLGGNALWDVVREFVGLLTLLIMAMFAFGSMIAVYLPMVPFIIWTTAIVSWVIVVFEAVLAAPIWAVAHMHPEGEGFAGQHAARGYMLILEIFMRPALMILGLIGSLGLASVCMYLVNATFFRYKESVQIDSINGLVNWVLFAGIYAGFVVALMHKSFSLIHVIPEKVLEWVGGHSRPDNPEGAADHTKNVFMGAASFGGRALSEGSALTSKAGLRRASSSSGGSGAAKGGSGGSGGSTPTPPSASSTPTVTNSRAPTPPTPPSGPKPLNRK